MACMLEWQQCNVINGHEKVVLWFSGGKDSMACLYLVREQLSDITVLFVNTGKHYPELLETVYKAKEMCSNWVEIKTDRDAQWKINGLPSDLVPIDWTILGQSMSSKKPITVQTYIQCCIDNIARPLWEKTKELGATLVIRGQRADEAHRATTVNNDILDGIQFWHPLELWTKDEVLTYLERKMDKLPEHYKLDHSSMDCYDCTAFAAHSLDRVEFMRKKHPDLYSDYQVKIGALYQAISEPLEHYKKLVELN